MKMYLLPTGTPLIHKVNKQKYINTLTFSKKSFAQQFTEKNGGSLLNNCYKR